MTRTWSTVMVAQAFARQRQVGSAMEDQLIQVTLANS